MKRGLSAVGIGLMLVATATGFGVWLLSGESLRLKKITAEELQDEIKRADGELVVVNFWATWCPPCVEEFPDLMRFARDYPRHTARVIFVSADFVEDEEKVKDFLENQGVTGVSYLQSGDPTAFINSVNPAWSGALPATFIYGPERNLGEWREGKISYAELEEITTKMKWKGEER